MMKVKMANNRLEATGYGKRMRELGHVRRKHAACIGLLGVFAASRENKSADGTEVVPPASIRGLLWREWSGVLRPGRTKAFCFCPAPSATMTFCALNPAQA